MRNKEAAKTYCALVKNTRGYFREHKLKRAVIGLSGGVDSALTAAIAADAIGKRKVSALIMPSKATESKHNRNAIELAEQLGIESYIIPISNFVELFHSVPWRQNNIAKANIAARTRMVLLYDFANSKNAVVLGTGNLTELLLGYFTKYGDGASDILPLAELWKGEVNMLAKYRKIPKQIIAQPPTAGLWPGQTDEKELGASYAVIDKILKMRFEKGAGKKEIIRAVKDKAAVNKILRRVNKNLHKRELPQIISKI